MNDLDEKLEEILGASFRKVVNEAIEQHGETIVEFAERSRLAREEAIAEIKQAFIDAGYIDAKRMLQVAELLQEQAEILKDMADVNKDAGYVKQFPRIQGHGIREASKDHIEPLRTGQEWYDRFEKEMDEVEYDTKDEMARGVYRNATVMLAAKRVAGIK